MSNWLETIFLKAKESLRNTENHKRGPYIMRDEDLAITPREYDKLKSESKNDSLDILAFELEQWAAGYITFEESERARGQVIAREFMKRAMALKS